MVAYENLDKERDSGRILRAETAYLSHGLGMIVRCLLDITLTVGVPQNHGCKFLGSSVAGPRV